MIQRVLDRPEVRDAMQNGAPEGKARRLESFTFGDKLEFIRCNPGLVAQALAELLGVDPAVDQAVDGILKDCREEAEAWINS